MTKLNVDEYINSIRPNRKSAKIKPGFNSAKSGLFDNLQLSSMKQYQSETYEEELVSPNYDAEMQSLWQEIQAFI